MKIALACLALIAASPAAFAQTGHPFSNTTIVGVQANRQTGASNQASNAIAGRQGAETAQGPTFSETSRTPGSRSIDKGAVLAASPGEMLTTLFGPGPLVANDVAVGTQVNVQNGDGNVGDNALRVGQSGAQSAEHGGLVDNKLAIGTQVNIQNGRGNVADNRILFEAGGSSSNLGGIIRR